VLSGAKKTQKHTAITNNITQKDLNSNGERDPSENSQPCSEIIHGGCNYITSYAPNARMIEDTPMHAVLLKGQRKHTIIIT